MRVHVHVHVTLTPSKGAVTCNIQVSHTDDVHTCTYMYMYVS